MKKLFCLIVLTLILGLVLTGCLLSNVGQVPTSEQSGTSSIVKNGPPPNCKCIDFESTGLSQGDSVEGTAIVDPLLNINLLNESKSLILILAGTDSTEYTAYNTVPGTRNGCLNGDYGFGCPVLDVNGKVNLETALGNGDKIVFTFPAGVTVSNFSIMMFDYGDYYPSALGGPPHRVTLTGDDGSTAEYFGPDSAQNPGYDACAGVGQQILEITGSGISEVTLEFVSGTDPGIGFDDICFHLEVPIDIKPQSCPNPLNTKSNGVIPVAILGTEDFDVNDIDPASVLLEGVAPIAWAYEDVATPFYGSHTGEDGVVCNSCNTLGPDGYTDLTLKFDAKELIQVIEGIAGQTILMTELTDVDAATLDIDGLCILLHITGNLYNEIQITGEDVIKVLQKGK